MGNEYEIGIGEDVLRTALRLASQAASTAHFVALASGSTWRYEGDTLATFEAFRKSSYPAMLQEAMSFPNLTLCSGITDFRGLVPKDSRGHFGGESKDQLIAIICKWLRADGVKPRHTALYDTLGVECSATTAEIQKAYRRSSVRVHPDHGGSQADFVQLCRAKDVLSDPMLRLLYDNGGEIALEEHAAGSEMALDQTEAGGESLPEGVHHQWREVRPGEVLERGAEVRLDLVSGKNYVKVSAPPPPPPPPPRPSPPSYLPPPCFRRAKRARIIPW
jgi:hypothetical protein